MRLTDRIGKPPFSVRYFKTPDLWNMCGRKYDEEIFFRQLESDQTREKEVWRK